MAVSKLKELPVISLSGISDTDIMVLEDRYDTKQVSIKDLKLLFSSDEKLNAMKKYFEEIISQFENSIQSVLDKLGDDNSELKSKYTNIYNDIESIKRKSGDLQTDLINLKNEIDEISKKVDTNDKNIKEIKTQLVDHLNKINLLLSDNTTNKENISKLSSDNETNKEDIKNLQQECENIKDIINYQIIRFENLIQNNYNSEKEYITSIYEYIMKYIDYYHHIHDNPPNFDNPPANPDNPIAELPVGSVYISVDENFSPNGILPGLWEFKGKSIATIENNYIYQYIFIRIA